MRTWLREIRLSQSLTQEDIAVASGIKRPYYTAIENGDRQPSVKVAKKIANKMKFDWVIFFDDYSNESTLRNGRESNA
ncbi:helix-turn-helix transcriptional regulator [Loigolactobacillus coryniformis]|uniref:helix-turn-helix transcriptional regulator n=1 Tax=Loigolactobacillus TaxID=2767889 RepID=UPI000F74746E|nr:helix-turn-helix transcriptional regulator [Loigolactobacillus zhaoyuanensis]